VDISSYAAPGGPVTVRAVDSTGDALIEAVIAACQRGHPRLKVADGNLDAQRLARSVTNTAAVYREHGYTRRDATRLRPILRDDLRRFGLHDGGCDDELLDWLMTFIAATALRGNRP